MAQANKRRRKLELAAHNRNGYAKGCRCAECRADWAGYIRKWKHEHGVCKPRGEDRFYGGPFEAQTVKLTALALRLLSGTEQRTGRPRHDIVEQLVREHIADVKFERVA